MLISDKLTSGIHCYGCLRPHATRTHRRDPGCPACVAFASAAGISLPAVYTFLRIFADLDPAALD